MEIRRHDDAKGVSFPLPLYHAVIVGTARSRDGEDFDVVAGLTKNMAAELKERSRDKNDEAIQKFTGDRKRFGEGSYETWYGKGRVPFALVHHPTHALAAIVWIGPKPLGEKSLRVGDGGAHNENPGHWATVSLRSYPHFRGKGLMSDFTRFAMDIYKERHPDARFWIGTSDENPAMTELAKKLGFGVDEAASDRDAHWIVMAKE